MIWSVEMRLLVDDERWDVLEVKQQLEKTVAVVDAQPRFVTAQYWLVQATEELKRQPAKMPPGRELPMVRRTKPKGAGPQA
jgi:hypothetical protein